MGSLVFGGVRRLAGGNIEEEPLALHRMVGFRGVMAESLIDFGGTAGGCRLCVDSPAAADNMLSSFIMTSSTAIFFLGLRQSMSSRESSRCSGSRERFFFAL
jgi:hypothetical protein